MKSKTSKNILTTQLPSYQKPPVNEVICGIRYQKPENIKIPHIGILWSKVQEDYPNIQHASPIFSSALEDISTGFLVPRIWFINEQDDQLIQFQFDRFYYNWRRRNNKYPHYPYVMKKFLNTYETIKIFFKDCNLGPFLPLELELTYINHIPKGEGWDSFEDIYNLFTDFNWIQRKGRFLPNPIKSTWTSVFQLPTEKGQMTVNIKEAMRANDKTPLIIFELITRKQCATTIQQSELQEWYDLAHKWIVKGFADLTNQKVQENIWERENV